MARKMTPQAIKQAAERRHQAVYEWLLDVFPYAEVQYNGDTGFDFHIKMMENRVTVEAKTSQPLVRDGQRYRQGYFEFTDYRGVYPYRVSQHCDLVALKGWYIFYLESYGVVGGIPADVIRMPEEETEEGCKFKRSVVEICLMIPPDWLHHFKEAIYGV